MLLCFQSKLCLLPFADRNLKLVRSFALLPPFRSCPDVWGMSRLCCHDRSSLDVCVAFGFAFGRQTFLSSSTSANSLPRVPVRVGSDVENVKPGARACDFWFCLGFLVRLSSCRGRFRTVTACGNYVLATLAPPQIAFRRCFVWVLGWSTGSGSDF